MANKDVRTNLTFKNSNIIDLGVLNFSDATTVTIASGVATLAQANHMLETESAAATDDVDTINGLGNGEVAFLRAANGAHTVVLKHGTGNIVIPGDADYSLDDTTKTVQVLGDGTNVHLVGAAGGGGAGSDTTAIHDNVASEILGIAQDTTPIATHEFLTENAAGTKKAVLLADLAYGSPPLGQAGDSSWDLGTRSHEGWEIFDTAHTFTVGSGQDFETLAAAAAAIKKLILVASPTVQLQESIVLASDVTFDGLISAGGALTIDLNGHDISVDDGPSTGITGNGQFEITYKSTNGASIIAMTASSLKPPYYLLSGQNGCLLNLTGASSGNTLTLEGNSKAFVAGVTIYKAFGRFYNVVYSNLGSSGTVAVYATETSHGGFMVSDPANLTADRGSILIKTDGTVVTT